MSNVAPMVQVFIFDTTGADAYSVTLSYRDASGAQHTVSIAQLAATNPPVSSQPNGNNTLAVFNVDAFAINSITVQPLKLTGAAYQQ